MQSSVGNQEQVEDAAAEEIKEIVEHKQRVERRRTEIEARQRIAEKERENMGVMWGIGQWGHVGNRSVGSCGA